MTKLVKMNHPALHGAAQDVPIDAIGSGKIKKVIKDMRVALTAYDAKGFSGVAIAAPQIGVPLRIFLVHDTNKERKTEDIIPDLVAINPNIVKLSKRKHVVGEGCLSVPDQYGAVSRSTQATLRAYDEYGRPYERGAKDLLAQIFQHEVDHLDGILFTDRAEKIFHKDEIEKQKLREAGSET
jgi:peptide deformylase